MKEISISLMKLMSKHEKGCGSSPKQREQS